ncbi:peptide MFS transporter [Nocardiopsis potens]|uniref:peptide MFS transporter n=1 Tax=Nocardiopsis potens TaxID=1246458 RepID=UPI00034DF83A|nr:oligopeptide:H+ symporter [Nocardiopsis potens]
MAVRSSGRAGAERTFFGYPRWFGTLFVVDMWERFSFYGLLAILYLYLVAEPADGGMGMGAGSAAALVGMYMSLVFMASLPGGWISDRILGPRRATLWGGVLIACGHAVLAVPLPLSLYPGLGLVILGTGLVKPSMAALIGQMFEDRPERREAAFSVFYVSIQVSALFAPLITGYVAERVDWHLGFGIAAIGMLLGLVHYVIGLRGFGDVGARPGNPAPEPVRRLVLHRTLLWGGLFAVLVAAGLASSVLNAERLLMIIGAGVLAVPVVYGTRLVRGQPAGGPERTRLRAFMWMLGAAAVFWTLYAQGPALLNQFALDSVERTVSGFLVPASWFQSAQPLFLLMLAPLFAALWVRLGGRVGAVAKFSVGMLFGGLAFAVMGGAALGAEAGPVSPLWLLGAYLLLVVGELAVAPVGLSLAAEVAPRGYDAQVLAMFWLSGAVGAALGGQVAHLSAVLGEPAYYALLGGLGLFVALALTAARRTLNNRLKTHPQNLGEFKTRGGEKMEPMT